MILVPLIVPLVRTPLPHLVSPYYYYYFLK